MTSHSNGTTNGTTNGTDNSPVDTSGDAVQRLMSDQTLIYALHELSCSVIIIFFVAYFMFRLSFHRGLNFRTLNMGLYYAGGMMIALIFFFEAIFSFNEIEGQHNTLTDLYFLAAFGDISITLFQLSFVGTICEVVISVLKRSWGQLFKKFLICYSIVSPITVIILASLQREGVLIAQFFSFDIILISDQLLICILLVVIFVLLMREKNKMSNLILKNLAMILPFQFIITTTILSATIIVVYYLDQPYTNYSFRGCFTILSTSYTFSFVFIGLIKLNVKKGVSVQLAHNPPVEKIVVSASNKSATLDSSETV